MRTIISVLKSLILLFLKHPYNRGPEIYRAADFILLTWQTSYHTLSLARVHRPWIWYFPPHVARQRMNRKSVDSETRSFSEKSIKSKFGDV